MDGAVGGDAKGIAGGSLNICFGIFWDKLAVRFCDTQFASERRSGGSLSIKIKSVGWKTGIRDFKSFPNMRI